MMKKARSNKDPSNSISVILCHRSVGTMHLRLWLLRFRLGRLSHAVDVAADHHWNYLKYLEERKGQRIDGSMAKDLCGCGAYAAKYAGGVR